MPQQLGRSHYTCRSITVIISKYCTTKKITTSQVIRPAEGLKWLKRSVRIVSKCRQKRAN